MQCSCLFWKPVIDVLFNPIGPWCLSTSLMCILCIFPKQKPFSSYHPPQLPNLTSKNSSCNSSQNSSKKKTQNPGPIRRWGDRIWSASESGPLPWLAAGWGPVEHKPKQIAFRRLTFLFLVHLLSLSKKFAWKWWVFPSLFVGAGNANFAAGGPRTWGRGPIIPCSWKAVGFM